MRHAECCCDEAEGRSESMGITGCRFDRGKARGVPTEKMTRTGKSTPDEAECGRPAERLEGVDLG